MRGLKTVAFAFGLFALILDFGNILGCGFCSFFFLLSDWPILQIAFYTLTLLKHEV